MAIQRHLVEFRTDDPGEVLAALDALQPGEWCNLEPFVAADDLDELRARTPHPLLRMFMKAGAPIPLGTVMLDGDTLSVGLEHSHAARAIPYLREHGVDTPRAWKVKQDHARRGIVLAVPVGTPRREILDWVVAAAGLLSSVPVGAQWTALLCRPSG